MEEIWKDIKGYEQLYQISNFGRVKSLGNGKSWKREKIMCQQINKYSHILLTKNGKQKMFLVHRLVYEAFNGEIPEGMEVNHINENKTDNRLENLNLLTHKANNNWGTRNRRISDNHINGKKSKSVLQYDKDGNFIKEWASGKEIERQLGFNQSNISACCLNKYKQAYGYIWKYKEKAA